MLCCVGLLQHVQLKVLVANLGVSHSVITWRTLCRETQRTIDVHLNLYQWVTQSTLFWVCINSECSHHSVFDQSKLATQTTAATQLLTGFCVDLAKAVVAHLVHKAVEQHRWALTVHSELSSGRVVVVLLDVFACVCASSDPDHPEELIDICGEQRWGQK